MQHTQVQSLGCKDPLKKEMAPTPVFLPAESHGQRRQAGYSPRGPKRVRHDLATIMEAKKLNMAEKATKDKIPLLLYSGKIYVT